MSGVLGMILAGGEGTRLMPLTQSRSKPAVPFGGSYRLIDFVLNNFINSGFIKLFVLTQYKSQSLYLHLKNGWTVSGIPGCFIDAIPAQMRTGKEWYRGTADAIYQNLSFIEDQYPDCVCIFGSDHIYKMDIRQMVDFHGRCKAALTVAALKMPSLEAAGRFGVIEVDEEGLMVGFEEKPLIPKEIPSQPGYSLISMGNYIFDPQILSKVLCEDAQDDKSSHDFGKDIIPKLYPCHRVAVYDLGTNKIPGEDASSRAYWRDVGSIDAYFEAGMDLVSPDPPFRLFNQHWPLHTFYPPLAPTCYIDTRDHHSIVSQSLISAGCIIKGAAIKKSVLGFRCYADDGANVQESVLIGDVSIGAGCVIRRAIIDRHVQIAPGFCLGVDRKQDELLTARGHYGVHISKNGIVVIPKGMRLGF